MNWKQFLKPYRRKIVIWIIIFLILIYFDYRIVRESENTLFSFFVPLQLTNYPMPEVMPLNLLIGAIILYLISCLLFWIYDKSNKKILNLHVKEYIGLILVIIGLSLLILGFNFRLPDMFLIIIGIALMLPRILLVKNVKISNKYYWIAFAIIVILVSLYLFSIPNHILGYLNSITLIDEALNGACKQILSQNPPCSDMSISTHYNVPPESLKEYIGRYGCFEPNNVQCIKQYCDCPHD